MKSRWKRYLFTCVMGMVMLFCLGLPAHAQTVKTIDVTISPQESASRTIQKALDEALEDQSGGTLYVINLPKGTYSLISVLKVFSYTTINMNGCTLKRGEDKSMLRIGYEEDVKSGYNGQHDITIQGGTFDGDGRNSKVNSSMVRLGHGKNITFKNVTFQNVYNSHHVELAACDNVLFDNCIFKDFYGKGDTANSGNNEALQFDVLHNADHFPKYPGFDDTPCSNITVTNCTFNNLQRGVGTHSGVAGSYFTNITFTNNTFTNIKGYAMMATNYKDSTISGNVVQNCGAGILFRSMVQEYNNFYTPLKGKATIVNNANSVITNNVIQVSDHKYKTTAYGISLYGENLKSKKKDVPKGNYTLKGVTVSGNTITMNNSGYGIWLQGANNCNVLNNTVTMNIAASVSGKGNSDCIRLVKSKSNQITNNVLTQKKKNKKTKEACGIVVTTNSNATIKNNKINNSPKDGIFVTAKSSAKITGNTIKKCGRYGLFAAEKSTITDKKNTIKKAKKEARKASADSKIKGK